jgi:hypothetical protein
LCRERVRIVTPFGKSGEQMRWQWLARYLGDFLSALP